ncbi:hypothetical protein BLA29_000706 [Euroglyphus maynei]|uniref:Uncharacterized protein n=1 Tax=Euroglyphus maynei TaxID=6958 RepID=A0A1Y3ARJ4_EURMA|nr:hypothetical protein BLA29_000706 [Euroglyphus maynei]
MAYHLNNQRKRHSPDNEMTMSSLSYRWTFIYCIVWLLFSSFSSIFIQFMIWPKYQSTSMKISLIFDMNIVVILI